MTKMPIFDRNPGYDTVTLNEQCTTFTQYGYTKGGNTQSGERLTVRYKLASGGWQAAHVYPAEAEIAAYKLVKHLRGQGREVDVLRWAPGI